MSAYECLHENTVLLRLDCGAGGIQYRRYCLSCWTDRQGAIKHAAALAELKGEEAPLADIELLHKARDGYLRTLRGRS